MAHPAMMPTGIINLISPGGGDMDMPETEMPAGTIYPINPVMALCDLAGGRRHTPRTTLPAGIVYPISRGRTPGCTP